VAEVEVPDLEELREKAQSRFARRAALVTAVYAIALALASLGGNNAMKEMLLAKQQASDQWAFYQAKVVREHLYRSQKLLLEVALADGVVKSPQLAQLAAKFAAEEKRYNAEKKDIEKEAKRLERERDVNQSRDPYFDYAEVLLQIAIVAASVSILASSRPMFGFSMLLAAAGAALAANGFLLWVRLPLLHGH
jgi:hypothetical protein